MRRKRSRVGRPSQITVKLSIPFVGEISGVWAPSDVERRAAWELYVELVTRIAVEDLGPDDGTLRAALNSLYTLFGTVREILRRYGPEVAPRRSHGRVSFGSLAVRVLNKVLRPVLARWHPRLDSHEAARPRDADPVRYEREWAHADELREELARVRGVLTELAAILAEVAGAEDLVSAPVSVPEASAERERERE